MFKMRWPCRNAVSRFEAQSHSIGEAGKICPPHGQNAAYMNTKVADAGWQGKN